MKCERVQELISARIDKEIIFDDEVLNDHLEDCADCCAELEGMRRLDDLLLQSYAPKREEAEVLADKVVKSLQARRWQVKRCTVLLVDDEPSILDLSSRMFSDEFDVLIAGSAREAQAQFEKHKIDIVLTDQRMPGETGVELLEWVLARHPQTQRLLWTAADELEDAVDAINRGQVFRYLFKSPTNFERVARGALREASRIIQLERENQRVLRELSELNVQLEERVRHRTRELVETNLELEQQKRTLEKFALTDALTLLPNRKALDHFVDRELYLCRRFPAPMAVAIIDVDLFKRINTDFYHPGGDHVLRELAKCMMTTLRKLDVLGRWAGDEFMLIAPQTHRAGALVLAERLRVIVQNHPFIYQGQRIPVTITIGLAVVEAGRLVDYDQVKFAAATALKRAKDNGRNCVEIEAVVPSIDVPPDKTGERDDEVASA